MLSAHRHKRGTRNLFSNLTQPSVIDSVRRRFDVVRLLGSWNRANTAANRQPLTPERADGGEGFGDGRTALHFTKSLSKPDSPISVHVCDHYLQSQHF